MNQPEDPFDRVRREPDPLRQARVAGELITLYQQRSVELARLRREAINRAAKERGLSFSAIAAELGLTRGRISQIRHDAPPAERAFFGVGPVTVALPLRTMPGRPYPVISSEDARAADRLSALLTSLAFQVEQYQIPTDGLWEPRGDTVAICGPKSSIITARAIEADPFLSLAPDEAGVWRIHERDGSRTYESPMDSDRNVAADVAYVARLPHGPGTFLVIAGVHALGSVGAVDYLTNHLADLYATVGEQRFSMVVQSTHDGDTVITSEAVREPRVHP